jgi:hypothetical protein
VPNQLFRPINKKGAHLVHPSLIPSSTLPLPSACHASSLLAVTPCPPLQSIWKRNFHPVLSICPPLFLDWFLSVFPRSAKRAPRVDEIFGSRYYSRRPWLQFGAAAARAAAPSAKNCPRAANGAVVRAQDSFREAEAGSEVTPARHKL